MNANNCSLLIYCNQKDVGMCQSEAMETACMSTVHEIFQAHFSNKRSKGASITVELIMTKSATCSICDSSVTLITKVWLLHSKHMQQSNRILDSNCKLVGGAAKCASMHTWGESWNPKCQKGIHQLASHSGQRHDKDKSMDRNAV